MYFSFLPSFVLFLVLEGEEGTFQGGGQQVQETWLGSGYSATRIPAPRLELTVLNNTSICACVVFFNEFCCFFFCT
ncbi:hypothetical protein B0T14DRAFT_531322 [Immersiella caudata]|uniref:Secreted protein n=1 Tax=Immersiella caudata TaxID=314043 RepID=A0AA39T1Y7_9PEZI|nr:hypothetical protein B0T14DRAFT_531322 [Immersiella caudata]